jgi:hypothetical protein
LARGGREDRQRRLGSWRGLSLERDFSVDRDTTVHWAPPLTKFLCERGGFYGYLTYVAVLGVQLTRGSFPGVLLGIEPIGWRGSN